MTTETELTTEAQERAAIRDSFRRGATIDEVARFYTKWSRERLEELLQFVVAEGPSDNLATIFTVRTGRWKSDAPNLRPAIVHKIDCDMDEDCMCGSMAAQADADQEAFAEEFPELFGRPPPLEIELDETQKKAVELIMKAPIGIVTGGAGTGKTTTLRAALLEMEKLEKRPTVALCAPTGKAARRIREATGRYAMTVHRLLGWEPGSEGMWHHNAGNALPYDVVIVDEASMLDTELAAALFDAVAVQRTRLILTGDVNQLPSVGPGIVFGDLLASGHVPVVRLEQVHRQAQKSWVYRNAPRVLEGEDIELDSFDDFLFYECNDEEVLESFLVEAYGEEVNKIVDALEKAGDVDASEAGLDRVQLLIPQKTGNLGCEAFNRRIQHAIHGELTKDDGFSISRDIIFTEGDKVIQTKNNYTLGVMNGETGVVTGYTNDRLEVVVDDNVIAYSRGDALDLQLGYAVTIHKMQGSQADTIVMLCSSQHSRMLTRQLFYTGITRAAKRLILVGDTKAIDRALKIGTIQQRQTKLVERLKYVLEE